MARDWRRQRARRCVKSEGQMELPVMSECDDVTPREVWCEYEAAKRLLDRALDEQLSALQRARNALLEAMQEELGCGVPREELSPSQRERQALCMRFWREQGGRCAR